MALSQKGNLARVLSMRSLQVESIFPMAHNEEKVKRNCRSWLELGQGKKAHFSRNEKRTFSLSQMNNAELAQTLSRRENALFEEREKND